MIERFLAKTDKYEVVVVIAPCGLDRSITLNGVKCRSLYDAETAEVDARYIVGVQFGPVRSWARLNNGDGADVEGV
jgi:hypothetical protein